MEKVHISEEFGPLARFCIVFDDVDGDMQVYGYVMTEDDAESVCRHLNNLCFDNRTVGTYRVAKP